MLHPLWTRVRRALLVSTALVFAVLTLSTSAAQAQDVDWVITPEGLGPLQLGASIDDVIASLPEGHTIAAVAPVAADFEGRVVSVDGAVYAIVRVDDAGRIDRIVVLDDAYRSAEGVGPGSAITEAEGIYGDAQLSWSPDDLGRERVVFEANPTGLSFRASEDGGPQAGIYGQGTVTVLHRPGAALTSVWIIDPSDEAYGAAPRPVPQEAADDGLDDTAPASPDAPADSDPTSTELPRTGVETASAVSAAFALVFAGLGITRVAGRMGPWS